MLFIIIFCNTSETNLLTALSVKVNCKIACFDGGRKEGVKLENLCQLHYFSEIIILFANIAKFASNNSTECIRDLDSDIQ
jgi:hypothetical protein